MISNAKEIEQLIGSNNLKGVITILMRTKFRDEAILLNSRLNALNKEVTLGLGSQDKLNIELNNIRLSLLSLSKDLEINDEIGNDKNNKNLSLADELYYQDRYSEAINEFKVVLLKKPNDVDVYYKLGRCYLMLKSYEHALEIFQKALSIDDKSGKVLNGIGVVYSNLNDVESALFYYGQALLIEPLNQLFFNNKFSLLKKELRYNELVKFCDFFVQKYNNNSFFYFKRGTLYGDYLDSHEKALADYSKALQIEPNNPEYYCTRSLLYSKIGQFNNSIADIHNSIALAPDVQYLKTKAAILHDYSDFKGAIQLYDQILKVDQNNDYIYYCKATAFCDLGMLDEANRNIDKAISIVPWKPKYYYYKSRFFVALNDYSKANVLINKAISLDDGNSMLYKEYKAAILLDMKLYAESLQVLDEIAQSNLPKDSKIFLWRGICCLELKYYNDAISNLKYSIELSPEDCSALEYLAYVYSLIGDSKLSSEYKSKEAKCRGK